jgi:hypothetical protein
MDSEEEKAPRHLLRRIDRAFDAIASSNKRLNDDNMEELAAPPTVRRRRGEGALAEASGSSNMAGGFLPPSPPAAGGFLLDDEEPEVKISEVQPEIADHIPLSMIPSALQLLDLPPADEEVMEIFRNAAGGWNGSRDSGDQGVSRKDWRAVCLVLLNGNGEEESEVGLDDEIPMHDEEIEEDDSSQDQEYREEGDDSMEDVESDEDNYTQKSRKGAEKGKRTAATRQSKRAAKESSEEPKTITRRQRAACREAFALFFPDVEDKDMDSQRIMIKDIVRVSGVLKEKVTAEEVRSIPRLGGLRC